MTRESVGSDPTAASAPSHEVSVDKCDENKDEVREVNSEVTFSDIFEEGIGKIFNACTPVFILLINNLELMYLLSL